MQLQKYNNPNKIVLKYGLRLASSRRLPLVTPINQGAHTLMLWSVAIAKDTNTKSMVISKKARDHLVSCIFIISKPER